MRVSPRTLRDICAALLCAAAAARGAGAATCSPTTFVRGAPVPGGAGSGAVATADLRGIGRADLLITAGTQATVLLSNGDGTFAAPTAVEVPSNAVALVVADFDEDGKPDLAVADVQSVHVFIGNGDGTFQTSVDYPESILPQSFIAADFNGDGHLDLAESGINPGGVQLLFGHGDGTFDQGFLDTGGGTTSSIAAGDLNGDGRADLVGLLPEANLWFEYLGNADGTFTFVTTPPLAQSVQAIGVADIDGDGKLDVVAAGSAVLVFLGNGDGSLQPVRTTALPTSYDTLLIRDLDGDGVPDLALEENTFAILSIMRGRGDGFFDARHSYEAIPGLAAADFNGDGIVDVATFDPSSSNVMLLEGSGGGRFVGIEGVVVPFPESFAVGDFDSDGRDDLAVLSGIAPLKVFSRQGTGAYHEIAETPLSASQIGAADLDGDGKLDAVAINFNASTLTVLPGNGDGTFLSPQETALTFYPTALAIQDFDGDGVPDLVVTGIRPPTGLVAVMLGNGDGTFQTPVEEAVSGFPTDLVVADFDSDGRPDVVVTGGISSEQGFVSVLLNRGGAILSAPVVFETGPQPVSLAPGDFDGDGAPDLIVADFGGANVTFLHGDGQGGFSGPTLIAVGSVPNRVVAADFNGDGKLDFAMASSNSDRVSVLLGRGDGGFDAPTSYPARGDPLYLAAGRFDDGDATDLAVGTQGYSLWLLLNARLSADTVADRSIVAGGTASLTVTASGFGPLTYQWRKNGVPLSDGGTISGSHTATLTNDPVSFADAGSYDVVVTDSCTSVTSNAATLSVEFADVPLSSIFHDDIIKIATVGITAGCGGGNYCPTNPVRRDQMAVFLLKAEHGSGYAPPACSGVFADVPCPGPFTDWVERLSAEGITGGCGGGDYCPGNPVTRAQMAVLLLKTKLGSSYTPPPAVGIFGDVPVGSFAADFIEDLYNRGITGGCSASPLLYCPSNPVNRGQMATFLVRTFLTP